MARTKESVVFIDTHVVVWLYAGLTKKFSSKTKQLMNSGRLYISVMVKLELQYLFETGRVTEKPDVILKSLKESMGVETAKTNMKDLVDVASTLDWARVPFDRLLTAEAHLHNAYFVTADTNIRKNYRYSVWS